MKTLETTSLKAVKVVIDYEKEIIIVTGNNEKDYYLNFSDLSENIEENILKILKIGHKYYE